MASADETILGRAVATVEDPSLRATLEREIALLRDSRRFGLVFDRHLPESARLPRHPVRPGVRVLPRDESTDVPRAVVRATGRTGERVLLDDGSEHEAAELVVLREFNEPILPGLAPIESHARADADDPWHVVVRGENLHALQLLRVTHRAQVDLIYIDPPYNTGNDGWIYNDRYVDGNDRARSSKWLSFMERRLLAARDLLAPTGVIIVAIGDDEHHRLRMLMDEVFGAGNFISDVVWQGGRKNDSRYVSNGADYMLVYARDETALSERGIRWRESRAAVDVIVRAGQHAWAEADGEPERATKLLRAWWSSLARDDAALPSRHYDRLDGEGRPGVPYFPRDMRSPNPRPNLMYDLVHPTTGRPVNRHPNGWVYSEERMRQLVAEGRVRFGPDESTRPTLKRYVDEGDGQAPTESFYVDRRAATKHLLRILGDARFPYPKDHEVLMRWIGLAAPQDALVLDFFGGSGTTTEAVMRLNAQDGGTRRSILVTSNEVGPKVAKALRKEGLHPGDEEWEARGVFEHVTRPRIATVVTGERPDGSTYDDPVDANVALLEVAYLDAGQVRRGRAFAEIAPVLWLESGATGPCIDADPGDGWALSSTYGVLFDPDASRELAAAVETSAGVRRIYVDSDSPAEVRSIAEQLPSGLEVVALFEDYVRRFTGVRS